MEFGTAIAGTIIVALCVVPFALMQRKLKQKERHFFNGLLDLAKIDNNAVSEFDFLTDFSIGLDDSRNYLLFFRDSHGVVESFRIDLREVKDCKLINVGRMVDSKSPRKVVDKLQLQISYLDQQRPISTLRFYDSDVNMQQNGELLLINKWAAIVKEKIARA